METVRLYNRIANTTVREDELQAFEAGILNSQVFLETIQQHLTEDLSNRELAPGAKLVTKELEAVVIRDCESLPPPLPF
jgi:hypothetical protein